MKLGEIFIQLKLDYKEFKDALLKQKAEAEKTAKKIEEVSVSSAKSSTNRQLDDYNKFIAEKDKLTKKAINESIKTNDKAAAAIMQGNLDYEKYTRKAMADTLKSRTALNQQQLRETQKTDLDILKSKMALNQQQLRLQEQGDAAILKSRTALNQQRLKEENAISMQEQKLAEQRVRLQERADAAILKSRVALNQQRLKESISQGKQPVNLVTGERVDPKVYEGLTRGMAQARLEMNKSLGPQKSYIQNTIEISKKVLAAAPGFAIATAAIAGFYSALRMARDEFIAGLRAVEDYKVSVASMAAFMTTFSKKAQSGDPAGAFKEALFYSEKLVPTLEILDARTIATGKDLVVMAQEFIKQGVQVDVNNKKTLDGFVNIANAVKLLTQGQNQSIQLHQEIRSMLQGQSRESNILFKTLEAIDPQLKSHLKTWKQEGVVIERIGGLLSGFSESAGLLQGTWAVVGTTLSTIHDRILRAAWLPTFEKLIGLSKEFSSKFMDSQGNLTVLSQKISAEISKMAVSFLKVVEQVVKLADYFPLILNSIKNISAFVAKSGALYLGFLAVNKLLSVTLSLVKAIGVGAGVAQVAITGMATALNASFKTLLAFTAGWQIGTWLSENFESVRKASVLMVDTLMKGWVYLEYGAKVSWEAISFYFTNMIAEMKDAWSGFLLLISNGLSKLPYGSKASAALKQYADSINGVANNEEEYKNTLGGLQQNLKDNLKAHQDIITTLNNEAEAQKKLAGGSNFVQAPELIAPIDNEAVKKQREEYDKSIKSLQDLADSLKVKNAALDKSKASEMASLLTTEKWQETIRKTGEEGKKLVAIIMGLAIARDRDISAQNADKNLETLRERLEQQAASFDKGDSALQKYNKNLDLLAENLKNASPEGKQLEEDIRKLNSEVLKGDIGNLTDKLNEFINKYKDTGGLDSFQKAQHSLNLEYEKMVDVLNSVIEANKKLIEQGQKPILSPEQIQNFNNALVSARDDGLRQLEKVTLDTTTKITAFWEEAQRSMQNISKTFFFDMMKGNFDDLGDRFADMVLDMVANWQAAQLQMALWGNNPNSNVGFGNGLIAAGVNAISPSTIQNANVDSALTDYFGSIDNGFANGGVMSSNGALSLRRYASGGIANSPQVAMFGEGSKPEAYVPLNDGRSIPVTMNDSSAPVNVIVNNYSGESVKQREFLDAKGGRSIEIQIGEIVAANYMNRGALYKAINTNKLAGR